MHTYIHTHIIPARARLWQRSAVVICLHIGHTYIHIHKSGHEIMTALHCCGMFAHRTYIHTYMRIHSHSCRHEIMAALDRCDMFARRARRDLDSPQVAFGMSQWLFRYSCTFMYYDVFVLCMHGQWKMYACIHKLRFRSPQGSPLPSFRLVQDRQTDIDLAQDRQTLI
jgi:hypothetical protein